MQRSFLCGKTVYSYVPTNSSGGPCSLQRLFLCQRPHPARHHRELTLGPDCNSELYLFSPAEYVALSLFVMLAMTVALTVVIRRIACSVAKALNTTSQVIHANGEEQLREAVLENKAATDCC